MNYDRKAFEEELGEALKLAKGYYENYENPPYKRLLNWFSENERELSHVEALRKSLNMTIAEKVEVLVDLETEREIVKALRRKLRDQEEERDNDED